MPLTATCPNCSARYRLGDELAGKTVTCKKCNNRFTVQATGANGGGAGDSAGRPKPTKPREDEGDLDFNRDDDRPKKKKGNKTLFIILGILLGLTLFCCAPIGVGTWWFVGRVQQGVKDIGKGDFGKGFEDAFKKAIEEQQKKGGLPK